MSHFELRPEKWEKLLKAKESRENNLYKPLKGNTDMFLCRQCSKTIDQLRIVATINYKQDRQMNL